MSGNKKEGVQPSLTTPTQGPTDTASGPGPLRREGTKVNPRRCPKCGHGCETNGGLQKHMKLCITRDTSKCQFSERTFPTFQGVRQHEKKAHPDLYAKEMEDSLPSPEHEFYEILAAIEVSTLKGKPFVKEIEKATGLPSHQIRHKRDKTIYKEYLAQVPAVLPIASSPGIHSSRIPGPSTGRIPWAAPVTTSDSEDSWNDPPQIALTSKKRLRQADTPSPGAQAPPRRPRVEYSTTASQDPSPLPPEVRQLSESPLAAPEVIEITTSPHAVAMDEQPGEPTIDPDLYRYLLSSKDEVEDQLYKGTLSSTDNLIGLIDAGMEASDQELPSFI
ncbi:unnamed protein product [Phaedon cochleariae]|uniref:Uncharacterized protein n=1 Tax=Phaedon cochleariae TaxID=80249 RepID=A0A9N9SN66_PHACE|nr:unnamed protein product [Phaedon cochleariae]